MGICQEIKLVPVYLGYDKTPEETAHVREMAGGRKVSESVKGFCRIYKSINTRLGRAYVKFGEPMSMSSLLAEHGLEKTCEIACDGINRVTPVTARGLCASALLSSPQEYVAEADALHACETLRDHAGRSGCYLAADADIDGLTATMECLEGEGHVTREERDGQACWRVQADGRRFLEYNKTSPCPEPFRRAPLEAIARGEGRRSGRLRGAGNDSGAKPSRRRLPEGPLQRGVRVRLGGLPRQGLARSMIETGDICLPAGLLPRRICGRCQVAAGDRAPRHRAGRHHRALPDRRREDAGGRIYHATRVCVKDDRRQRGEEVCGDRCPRAAAREDRGAQGQGDDISRPAPRGARADRGSRSERSCEQPRRGCGIRP